MKVVREAITKFVGAGLESEIHENAPVREPGLSERHKGLRPDMAFDRRTNEGKVKEIIEFSCPDGRISHDRDTLETVYKREVARSQELAKELTAITGSSMGAVYAPSLKALSRILNHNAGELRKLGKKMSEAAVIGSMAIWRMIVRTLGTGSDIREGR
jgi:hypothetical protein